MNKLIITSGMNNGWWAVVSNTDIMFKFAGADQAAQFTQVQALAQYLTMDTDGETVTRMLPTMFENVTNPPGTFETLFKGTNSMVLDERAIIDLGENVLADELMEVGEALLEAL